MLFQPIARVRKWRRNKILKSFSAAQLTALEAYRKAWRERKNANARNMHLLDSALELSMYKYHFEASKNRGEYYALMEYYREAFDKALQQCRQVGITDQQLKSLVGYEWLPH